MSRLSSQKVYALLVAVPLIIIAGYVAYTVFPTASNQGYAPVQPIPYSHKIHAGDNKIPCLYCHTNAEYSKHATVPGVGVCMNCHRVVKTESPYIQQIKKAFDEGKQVEWLRVHELPDFVYFPHASHVQKGVACQTCHGDIQNMERVYQAAPLTMGWCLDCHKGVSTPPKVLKRVEDDLKAGVGTVWKTPNGPVGPRDCSSCHR
jgi:hypothetical protein